MRTRLFLAAALVLAPTAASASETITYAYDAKGRLTQVAHSGGSDSGVVSTYAFDAADNRTITSVVGAWLDSQASPVIVLPLRGMPVLTLPKN